MILASAISAVEDALLALLVVDTGILALNLDVPPHLTEPVKGKRREVWIGEVVESDEEGDLSGEDTARVETFDLFVWCAALAAGDDFVGARDEADAIAKAVAEVVVANLDLGLVDPLGGIVNCEIHLGGIRRESGISTEGDRIVLNRVTVRCELGLV